MWNQWSQYAAAPPLPTTAPPPPPQEPAAAAAPAAPPIIGPMLPSAVAPATLPPSSLPTSSTVSVAAAAMPASLGANPYSQYTAAQYAAMTPEQQYALQQHWQQWQKYQEEYARWHAQYGEQYKREMELAQKATTAAPATPNAATPAYPSSYYQQPPPSAPSTKITGQPQIYTQPPPPQAPVASAGPTNPINYPNQGSAPAGQHQQQQPSWQPSAYNQPPPNFSANNNYTSTQQFQQSHFGGGQQQGGPVGPPAQNQANSGNSRYNNRNDTGNRGMNPLGGPNSWQGAGNNRGPDNYNNRSGNRGTGPNNQANNNWTNQNTGDGNGPRNKWNTSDDTANRYFGSNYDDEPIANFTEDNEPDKKISIENENIDDDFEEPTSSGPNDRSVGGPGNWNSREFCPGEPEGNDRNRGQNNWNDDRNDRNYGQNNRGYNNARGINSWNDGPNGRGNNGPNDNQNNRERNRGPNNWNQGSNIRGNNNWNDSPNSRGGNNWNDGPNDRGRTNWNDRGSNNFNENPNNRGPNNWNERGSNSFNENPNNRGPNNWNDRGSNENPNNRGPNNWNDRGSKAFNENPNNRGPNNWNDGPNNRGANDWSDNRGANDRNVGSNNRGPSNWNDSPNINAGNDRNFAQNNRANNRSNDWNNRDNSGCNDGPNQRDCQGPAVPSEIGASTGPGTSSAIGTPSSSVPSSGPVASSAPGPSPGSVNRGNRITDMDEQMFDRQFRQWEQQFEDWKKANANHPDKEMYKRYEQEFEKQRKRIAERREQMRRRKLEQMGIDPNQPPPQPIPECTKTESVGNACAENSVSIDRQRTDSIGSHQSSNSKQNQQQVQDIKPTEVQETEPEAPIESVTAIEPTKDDENPDNDVPNLNDEPIITDSISEIPQQKKITGISLGKRKSRFDTPAPQAIKIKLIEKPEVITLDDDDDGDIEEKQVGDNQGNMSEIFKKVDGIPGLDLADDTSSGPTVASLNVESAPKPDMETDQNKLGKNQAMPSTASTKKIPSLFDIKVDKPDMTDLSGAKEQTEIESEPPATSAALPDLAKTLNDPDFLKRISEAVAHAKGGEPSKPQDADGHQLSFSEWQQRKHGDGGEQKPNDYNLGPDKTICGENVLDKSSNRSETGDDLNSNVSVHSGSGGNRSGMGLPNNMTPINNLGPNNNFGPNGPIGNNNWGSNNNGQNNLGPNGPNRWGPNGPNNWGPNGPNNNFGPNGSNNNFGTSCPNGPNNNFGPNGPKNNFGPNGSNNNFGANGSNGPNNNFGPNGPNNNFGPNGPNNNFGPNGPNNNFGPNGPNNNFGRNNANNWGPNGPNNWGPNSSNSTFGRNGPNNNFGPNGPNNNLGPNGPNNNFGPNGPNNNFGSNGPNNNFGPNGPNNNFRGGNNFGPNRNFGGNGPNDGGGRNFGRNDGQGRNFDRNGPNFGPNDGSNRDGPSRNFGRDGNDGNRRNGGRGGSNDRRGNRSNSSNNSRDGSANRNNINTDDTNADDAGNSNKNVNNPFRRTDVANVSGFGEENQADSWTKAPVDRDNLDYGDYYRPVQVIDYSNSNATPTTTITPTVIDYGHKPAMNDDCNAFKSVKIINYDHASKARNPQQQQQQNRLNAAQKRRKGKNKNNFQQQKQQNQKPNQQQQQRQKQQKQKQKQQLKQKQKQMQLAQNPSTGSNEQQKDYQEQQQIAGKEQQNELEEISDVEEMPDEPQSPPPPPPPMFNTSGTFTSNASREGGGPASIFPSTSDANENIPKMSATHVQMSIPTEENNNTISIDEILMKPGRYTRPKRICMILRGPPGSGKSHVAKLIKEKEKEMGGNNPRILSIDDYFLIENDYEEKCPKTGKKLQKKEILYEYDKGMEEKYMEYLIKAFKKSVADHFYDFIVIDCNNNSLRSLNEFYCHSKDSDFVPYIIDLFCDLETCLERNIHDRSERDIKEIIDTWKQTPGHYIKLDISSLLQNIVEMEDAEDVLVDDNTVSDSAVDSNLTTTANNQNEADNEGNESDDNVDQVYNDNDYDEDDSNDSTENCGFLKSKWETDTTTENLARLDGTSKLSTKRKQTMEEYLQMDEWQPPTNTKGKKRVRWADIEEKRKQEKMRAVGFVVGQTDWKRMMDPNAAKRALNKTKYIERVNKRR